MEKTIKQITLGSFLILLLLLTFAGYSQYKITTRPINKELDIGRFKEVKQFIEKTKDINRLKGLSLILLKSDIEYTKHLHNLFYNIRNILLAFSIFPVLYIIYAYKLKKQLLTIKSSSPAKGAGLDRQ